MNLIPSKAMNKLWTLPLFYKGLIIYSLIALTFFGQGVYIKLKAELAQGLLELAWQRQQLDLQPHKAWPWADGYPMAKITINQQAPLIILTGATGSNLAFAPSWFSSSSDFNRGGNSVVFAHNDTHFKRLENIKIGDQVTIESANQQFFTYQISATHVTDETDLSVLARTDEEIITLITCYPFDSAIVNSDLRYVVTATRVKQGG